MITKGQFRVSLLYHFGASRSLGTHDARHQSVAHVGRTGQTATNGHSEVQQFAVVVMACALPVTTFNVHADEFRSGRVGRTTCHEVPAKLTGPPGKAGLLGWQHQDCGSGGTVAHSAHRVLVVMVIVCLVLRPKQASSWITLGRHWCRVLFRVVGQTQVVGRPS